MRGKKKTASGEAPEQREGIREEKRGKRLNREMAAVTYIFMILFLVMAGYIAYFVLHDSDKVLNNPYNKRQELLAERVTKGSILSDTGKALAKTRTDNKFRTGRRAWSPVRAILCSRRASTRFLACSMRRGE